MNLKNILNEFAKRNSPIFVIGGITAIIFLVVTVIARLKDTNKPEMVQLTDNQIKQIEKTDTQVMNTPSEIDEKYGILEIEYTQDGFNPKNTKSYPNQLVRWTNKTDQILKFQQVTKTHKDFPETVEIKPGETFEFRLTKTKLWSYQVVDNNKHFGTIFVLDNNY